MNIYRLVYISTTTILLWLVIEIVCIDCKSSIAHSVFLDPAEDNFFDSYVDEILSMDHEALLHITQLENRQLLSKNGRVTEINGSLDMLYLQEL